MNDMNDTTKDPLVLVHKKGACEVWVRKSKVKK